MQTEKGESRIAAEKVAGMFFGAPVQFKPRGALAVYQHGTRLTGDLVKIDESAVWLSGTTLCDELRIPFADLRSLIVLRH